MVARTPVKLVFYDTFKHDSDSEHVDSIKFKQPVAIKDLRIVPSNATPWKKLKFVGETKPRSFSLEVFGKNSTSQKFEPLIRAFSYKEGPSPDRIPTLNPDFSTDLIIIRGPYVALSLCIFGVPVVVQQPQTQLLDNKVPMFKIPSDLQPPASEHLHVQPMDAEETAASTTQEETFFELLNPLECTFSPGLEPHLFESSTTTTQEMLGLCHRAFGGIGGGEFEAAIQSLASSLDNINNSQIVGAWELWNGGDRESKNGGEKIALNDYVPIWLERVMDTLEGKYRGKSILAEYKASLAVISTLVRSPSTFIEEFIVRDGIKLLCDMVQTTYCSSLLRTAILRTLVHVISQPLGMDNFLRGKYDDEHSETGYQTIVRVLTLHQNTRVLDVAGEVLKMVQLNEVMNSLHTNVDFLIAEADPGVIQRVVDQLKFLDSFLKNSTHKDSISNLSSLPLPQPHANLPTTFAHILQSQRLLLLLATALAAPSLRNDHVQYLSDVYTGTKGVILRLLATLRGSLLIGADANVLRAFLNVLVSMPSNDTGHKHGLLSLTMSFAEPDSVTPLNLAYLITYHVQSFVELGLLQRMPKELFSEETQVNSLHNLYMMTLHDVGRHSVLSALMFSFNVAEMRGDVSYERVGGPLGVITRLLLPPEGSDFQAVPIMYAAALVLLLAQSEEYTKLVIELGPTIYQVVSMWESKSGFNSELKGRIQQILDWLKPAVVLKEKGVVGLVQSLKSLVSNEGSATVPSSSGDTVVNTTQVVSSAQSQAVSVTTSVSSSPPPQANAITTSQSLPRLYLNSLLSTLQILASIGDHHTVPILLLEEDALPILIELLDEATSSIEWEPSGGISIGKKRKQDEAKGAAVIKKERQHLYLATSILSVLTHILYRLGCASHKYQNKSLIDVLLRFHSALSSHPLFGNSSCCMSSGHGQLINRASQSVVTLLNNFMSEPVRVLQTLPDLLEHILSLPRYHYGGIYLLSRLLPRTLPITTANANMDNERIISLRNTWRFYFKEQANVDKAISLVTTLVHCSSKTLYAPLVRVIVQLVDFGAELGVAFVTPLIELLRNNSQATTLSIHDACVSRRTLYLILAIARTPAGKAILQQTNATTVVLGFLNFGSEKIDQECRTIALAIFQCFFLPTISLRPQISSARVGADDILSPDQLLKAIKAILQLLCPISGAPLGDKQERNTTVTDLAACLYLLKLLASHEYGAYHILLASTELEATEVIPSPYYNFLKNFCSHLKDSFLCSETPKEDITSLSMIVHEAIQFLDVLRKSTSSLNSWSYVGKFTRWHDSEDHPIVEISASITQYLSEHDGVINLNVSGDHDDELSERLYSCRDMIENMVKEFTSANKVPLNISKAPIAITPPTPLEERFNRRVVFIGHEQSGSPNENNILEAVYDDVVDIEGDILLEDDDFTKDLISPDSILITSLTAEEPQVVESPSPKKPRIELPPSQPKKRDLFRYRKPNTSRPPSVHVDAFKKPTITVSSVATHATTSPPPTLNPNPTTGSHTKSPLSMRSDVTSTMSSNSSTSSSSSASTTPQRTAVKEDYVKITNVDGWGDGKRKERPGEEEKRGWSKERDREREVRERDRERDNREMDRERSGQHYFPLRDNKDLIRSGRFPSPHESFAMDSIHSTPSRSGLSRPLNLVQRSHSPQIHDVRSGMGGVYAPGTFRYPRHANASISFSPRHHHEPTLLSSHSREKPRNDAYSMHGSSMLGNPQYWERDRERDVRERDRDHEVRERDRERDNREMERERSGQHYLPLRDNKDLVRSGRFPLPHESFAMDNVHSTPSRSGLSRPLNLVPRSRSPQIHDVRSGMGGVYAPGTFRYPRHANASMPFSTRHHHESTLPSSHSREKTRNDAYAMHGSSSSMLGNPQY